MTAGGRGVPRHNDVLRAAFGEIDSQLRALVENEVLRITDQRSDQYGPSVRTDAASTGPAGTTAFPATQAPWSR